MRVAGIDYSSRAVDMVLIHLDDLEPPEWRRYLLHGDDAFDRTRQIGIALPHRASTIWDDVLAIGIEHPAGHHGTGAMMRVQGAILSMLPDRLLVQPWPPGAWRKACGLPGNATKRDVMDYVQSEHSGWVIGDGPYAWPQDAYDAYCIAYATRAALTLAETA